MARFVALARQANVTARYLPGLTARRARPQKIPGLCSEKACRSRFSDDDVVTALVLRALDIPRRAVAAAIGAPETTIYQWESGVTRGSLIRRLG